MEIEAKEETIRSNNAMAIGDFGKASLNCRGFKQKLNCRGLKSEYK